MSKRLGVVSESEGIVEFFLNDKSLLEFIHENDPMIVGSFELDEKTETKLNDSFSRGDVVAVGMSVVKFPNELGHFEWFSKETE